MTQFYTASGAVVKRKKKRTPNTANSGTVGRTGKTILSSAIMPFRLVTSSRKCVGGVPARESGVGERVEMPKVLNNLDLAQNQLNNARIQNLATAPASPVEGQIYHNTVDHKTYVYNGSAWIDVTIAANGDVTVTFATLQGANTIRVTIAG